MRGNAPECPVNGNDPDMDSNELKIQIEGKPALTLRLEKAGTQSIELEEHWTNVSVAWTDPPDRLRLDVWIDACLPENGSREPYGARAGIALLEHRLRAATWEPAFLAWANLDAEYPGAVTFNSVCAPRRPAQYRTLTDEETGDRLYEAWAIANNAHKGKPREYPERRTSLSGMRGKIGLT